MTDHLNVRLGPDVGYPVRGQLNTGDEAEAIALSGDGGWLALDGLGWVFFDEEWVSVDGDVEALPGPSAANYYALVGPSYETGVYTGLSNVDPVVDAVEAGDLDALGSMLRVYPDVCPRDGPNLPPSCPDSENGAPIEVVLTTDGCEGAYVPANQRRAVAEAWFENRGIGQSARAEQQPRLYAVTQYDDGVRGVVFAFESGVGALVRVFPDGSIDLPRNDCERWPANLLVDTNPSRPAPELPLPPLPPEPLVLEIDFGYLPLDTRTGDPLTDAVLDALVRGDAEFLTNLVAFEVVPCVRGFRGFPSGPTCPDNEPDGTVVEAFLLYGNEGSYATREGMTAGFLQYSEDLAEGDLSLCAVAPGNLSFSYAPPGVSTTGTTVKSSSSIGIEDGHITTMESLGDAVTLNEARCSNRYQ